MSESDGRTSFRRFGIQGVRQSDRRRPQGPGGLCPAPTGEAGFCDRWNIRIGVVGRGQQGLGTFSPRRRGRRLTTSREACGRGHPSTDCADELGLDDGDAFFLCEGYTKSLPPFAAPRAASRSARSSASQGGCLRLRWITDSRVRAATKDYRQIRVPPQTPFACRKAGSER